MLLKEILQKLVNDEEPVLLSDSRQDWEANSLLKSLSESMLKRPAHIVAGLYIAEINETGYLGQVLFRIKLKA